MLLLEIIFISGRIWLDHKIRFFIAHNFHLSTLTGNEPNFQEKHLKILKRSTHTWTPLCSMFHSYLDPYITNVPLILWPHLDKRSTLTWTPSCWMFHSYLDPYGTYVPLIPWPHHYQCSIHTWTPPYRSSNVVETEDIVETLLINHNHFFILVNQILFSSI